MQFITVILLQQIFWMQGKKKKMARTLSECSCKFSFLLNPIFFFEFQDLFQMMICLMDLGLTLALALAASS